MKIFFLGTGFQCPTPSYLTKLGRPTPGVAQKKLVTHPPTKTSNADVDRYISMTFTASCQLCHCKQQSQKAI